MRLLIFIGKCFFYFIMKVVVLVNFLIRRALWLGQQVQK